ncbi:IclR family transcriptional regulator [Sedimentibacter sp.]|uniref:IclR family transcriptional regulator n=1 Tax=Sedimentibacter sp. TaxID=1960295 RepID=UPI0028AC780B|nr:IclR family transcriptional regulator [Sedimentibacter sp.]
MKNLGRVQSIDRLVAIIECFSKNKRELKLSEIANMVDLNKSTVHGILNTLKYHGFIGQDESTQKYRLGTRFIEYGDMVVNSMDVRNVAYPLIDSICDKIEETVHIAMLDEREIVYIEKKECNRSIKTSTKIGVRSPAYTTADGKVILSYLSEDVVGKYLPSDINESDKHIIIKKLTIIKEQGFYIDYEEAMKGIICVAAPIFDYRGLVRYSLSVTAPTVRMTDEKIKESIIIVKEAANNISYSIGYKG